MELVMFRRFSNAFDRLLSVQQALEAARRSDYFEYHTSNRGSYPFINLFQDGYDTVLTAEIPGVKREDINIEVKNNLIRISGKRSVEYPEKAKSAKTDTTENHDHLDQKSSKTLQDRSDRSQSNGSRHLKRLGQR